MRISLHKLVTALGVAVLSVSMFAPVVLAATSSQTSAAGGQALEIAPPLTYLNVDPGKTYTTKIQIRDVSNTNLLVTGQVNDFVAQGETGAPKVILNNSTPDPYSMKTWVAPIPSLDLVSKQIKSLTMTINVPANASPGGHYGVIRFTGTPPSLKGTGVSLSASIGVLYLLTVSGNIQHQLSVQQFSVSHNSKTGSLFQSGPLQFTEVIKNSGNVHEQPIGLVTVTDMFGHKLATLPVNQPPGNILPSSSRKFTENLNSSEIGNKKLFGHYTAKLSLTYGPNKKPVSATLSFWVIPYKLIAIIIAAIIVGFFILRYAIKRYNRYIRNQANSGRR